MGLEYKCDILEKLKAAGYSTDKLRQKKYLSESVIQHLRLGERISWASIERICSLLNCQPGDFLAYNGSPVDKNIRKEKRFDNKRREFEYLYWIWNSRFRKPGEQLKDFHQEDYASYLPVPADWEMPEDV